MADAQQAAHREAQAGRPGGGTETSATGAANLAAHGFQVRQNPTTAEVARARLDTGDTGDPASRPDYLIEGRVFDCYSPTTPAKKPRGIGTEVEQKVAEGQTQRAVVNLQDWRGDDSAPPRQFLGWPIAGLKELKVITPNPRHRGSRARLPGSEGAAHGHPTAALGSPVGPVRLPADDPSRPERLRGRGTDNRPGSGNRPTTSP